VNVIAFALPRAHKTEELKYREGPRRKDTLKGKKLTASKNKKHQENCPGETKENADRTYRRNKSLGKKQKEKT